MLNLQTVLAAPFPGARVYCPGVDQRPGGELATGKQVEYSSASDESLVLLLHRQEVQALEALYNRHSRAVYSLALKILADPTAAEEVVQECCKPQLFRHKLGF